MSWSVVLTSLLLLAVARAPGISASVLPHGSNVNGASKGPSNPETSAATTTTTPTTNQEGGEAEDVEDDAVAEDEMEESTPN